MDVFSATTALYVGNTSCSAAYVGDVKVWPTAIDYTKECFTMKMLSGGTLYFVRNNDRPVSLNYSKNGGEWQTITSETQGSATPISVSVGDTIRWWKTEGYNNVFGSADNKQSCFSGDCVFDVYGNVMSLYTAGTFENATTITTSRALQGVLSGTNVISAENLVFPATTLSNNCYRAFFAHSSIVTSPKEFPALTLASDCYTSMFTSAAALKTAPDFYFTTVASNSLNGAFGNCTSLETAPRFMNKITSIGSYGLCYCFANCSNLKYIKINSTYTGGSPFLQWVNGINTAGTFVANNANSWQSGVNGVPNNWTRIQEE